MTENGLGRRRQRDIIDRNAVADEISVALTDSSVSEQRSKALAVLQAALREGREEISRRLITMPSSGRSSATDQAFLIDQIIRIAYDFVTTSLFPVANRSAAEKIAVVAVGGYGRGEMAPHSAVDTLKWLAGYLGGAQEKDDESHE